jgi:tetratricopeptide (TPR) repeat protein
MFSHLFTKHVQVGIAALFMCLGITQIGRAQDVRDSITIRPPDPVVETNLRRPNSRRRLAPGDEKRRELALEITQGNDARQSGKYQLAVSAYERAVTLDAKDPRAHYGLGNVYVDLACSDSAIAEYQAALNLKGDFRDALIGLGYALANKQRYDEAESQFQHLLNIKKDDTAGRIGLAFVLWKRKKYDDAINQLDQVANTPSIKNEDRATAYLILGDIHRERNKWDNAREAYKQTIALNSAATAASNFVSIQAYIGLGLVELVPEMQRFSRLIREERGTEDHQQMISAAKKAEEYFHRAIYELKYDHPSAYLVWAFALEYQFQFRDAEEKFNQYLKKVNELENQLPALSKTKACDYGFSTLRANYYRFQANSYLQERLLTTDYQRIAELDRKIVESLEQVIRLTADAGAYSNLAEVYFSQGKYGAAIEQYENALSRVTDESMKASVYLGRGTCYAKIGRLQDAIDDLNRAIKIKPDVPLYYWSLSSFYQKQGNWDEAISVAEKAMAREQPPTPHSYFFYASLYSARWSLKRNDADYEKAVELAKQAININAAYANPYLLLANLYKNYKGGVKADEAIANYELAARYDSNNALIYFGLGDLYLGFKNNDNAAIQNLAKAVLLKPDFAQAYYELGRAYSNKRDYAEAAKQFQNAIKNDPKYLDAYLDLADVYDQQGNYDDSIKWLLKATEEFPTEYLPYKEAARIYSHYQKNDEAIEYYEKAIGLVKGDMAWFGEIMKCRIPRVRGQYAESIACFQTVKLPNSGDPNQIPYELGLTYVASGNKQAARAQYEELKRRNSSLAGDLLKQINQMK